MTERSRKKRKNKRRKIRTLSWAAFAAAGMLTLGAATQTQARDVQVDIGVQRGQTRGHVNVRSGSQHHGGYGRAGHSPARGHIKHDTHRGHQGHAAYISHRRYGHAYGYGHVRHGAHLGRGHVDVVIHRPVRVHRVWVPGHFRYRNEKYVIRDGYHERRWVPAVTEEGYDRRGRYYCRQVRPGYHEKVWVPAKMGVRQVRVWVPGHYVTP